MTEANNVFIRWWKRTDELFKYIVIVLSVSAFISYILSSIYDWVFFVTFFCVAIVLVLFSIICFFSVVSISILLDFINGFLEFIGIPYALPFSSKRKHQQQYEKLVDEFKINIVKYSPYITGKLNEVYGNVDNWDRNYLKHLLAYFIDRFCYKLDSYNIPKIPKPKSSDIFACDVDRIDFEAIDWEYIFSYDFIFQDDIKKKS